MISLKVIEEYAKANYLSMHYLVRVNIWIESPIVSVVQEYLWYVPHGWLQSGNLLSYLLQQRNCPSHLLLQRNSRKIDPHWNSGNDTKLTTCKRYRNCGNFHDCRFNMESVFDINFSGLGKHTLRSHISEGLDWWSLKHLDNLTVHTTLRSR